MARRARRRKDIFADTDHLPSNDMEAFSATLKASKHIIAVAGAGLSAASGIPTFRGAGGMWRTYNAMSLATPEAFALNPSRVWQFYHYRREKAHAAEPNRAHLALAQFMLPLFRDNIVPGSTFTLITQNVDGLSPRASEAVKAQLTEDQRNFLLVPTQPPILEMHGRLFDIQCTDETCGHIELNLDSPICPALGGTEIMVEAGTIDPVIPEADLPRCSACGKLARPGVVWFGEQPVHMEEIDKLVDEANLCLVVGTSSTVYPAAMYASEVQRNGGKVAVFNLDRSEGDSEADFLFLGPAEETLPKALGLTV